MASSVSSGSTPGNWFLRGAIAAALFSFAWFQGCGIADVKQAGDTTTAQGAGGASSTGASTATGSNATGSSATSGSTTESTTSSMAGGVDTVSVGAGGGSSGTVDTVSTGMGGASMTTTGAGGMGVGGAGGSAPPPPPSARVDVVINPGWKFNKADVAGAEAVAFNDAAWMTVNLPHTYNSVDGWNGPTTTPAYYRGIAWYRKHYTFPADSMTGKKIYLQFDASAFITDVWVNGMKVGSHSGGYAMFRFDITAVAKIGMDNIIAVKVDNSQAVTSTFNLVPNASTANVPPRSGDFTMYGGIYRDLHVLATDPLAITPMDFSSPGVYLRTTNVSAASADLSVTVKLINGNAAAKMAAVEAALVDATGATVQTLMGTANVPANGTAEAVLTGKVANPHLWDGVADPYLYRVNVVLKDGTRVSDAVAQPLGFRFYAMNVNTGFSLNGKPYPLRGVCMHQDHQGKGNVFSPTDIDNDFVILKEMGVSAIRFAHYQHPQYTYDKADAAGIIGWAENPVIDSINDTPEYLANSRQQLQELIRQNFNHPSIFIWASSNEILLRPSTPANANILPLVTSLNALTKQEDPARWSINSCANNLQEDPINYVADLAGFNRYNGWYYQVINDFGPWADMKHATYPNKPLVVAEYGAGSSLVQHGLPIVETGTNRQDSIQTEEYGTIFHERYWAMIATRPFLVWTSVWNMFDFAADYRNEGLVPGLNTKGLVSYDRQTRKDSFYLYKAAWSKEPFVHINYRRFTNMPRSATEIRAYSNQPTVDLKLNGVSLGAKTAPNHIFVWTGVTWGAGMNVAEATAGTLTDRVTWTN